jgi:hypothetical protein
MKIFLQTLLSVCILLSVVAAHKMPSRRLLAPPPALVKAKEADTEPKSVTKSSQVKQKLPKALAAPKPKGPLAPPVLVKAKESDTEPKSVTKSSQVKQKLPKALAAPKPKGPLAPPVLVKAKEADTEPKSVTKSSQVKQKLPKALAANSKGPEGKTTKAKRE